MRGTSTTAILRKTAWQAWHIVKGCKYESSNNSQVTMNQTVFYCKLQTSHNMKFPHLLEMGTSNHHDPKKQKRVICYSPV